MVSGLPVSRGGLSLPDVRSHVLAMQAKSVWLLFRHSSHPWHALFVHEVVAACDALPHCPPGLHCLVTAPSCVRVERLRSPLLRSAVAAFRRLGVARILPPAEQSPWSVLLEHTFHNAPSRDHPALLPAQLSSPAALAWHRLADVRAAHLSQAALPPAVQVDLAVVLAWLPAPWLAVVCSAAAPPAPWTAFPAALGSAGMQLEGPDPVTGAVRLWELWPSGRLHPLPAGVAHPMGPGLPACVWSQPKPPTAWDRSDLQFQALQQQRPAAERQPLLEPWFVGLWPRLALDPSVWGLQLPSGQAVSLLELQVRHARQQVAHTTRVASLHTQAGRLPGYREEQAAWPRSWRIAPEDPAAGPGPALVAPELLGLEGLEARWRQSASDPAPAPALSEQLDWAPPWLALAPAPAPRVPPLARAAARQDEGPGPPVLRPGFSRTWQRLTDPTLHRPFRLTCWRLLHGCLGCKAFLHHVRRHQGLPPVADVMCEAPACAALAPLETLSHAFLDCPAAAPAIDWLLSTWAQLSAQAPPPRSARVLLADDLDAWPGAPTDARTLALWTRLRVAVLGAVWELRCSRPAGGESFARQAVRLALQHLLGALQRDWARTQGDVRSLDAGGFCLDWWRGVDTVLTVDQFVTQWALPPLLCRVVGERPLLPGTPDERTLELLLRPEHPVPLPA